MQFANRQWLDQGAPKLLRTFRELVFIIGKGSVQKVMAKKPASTLQSEIDAT